MKQQQPAVIAAEFTALFDRCLAFGLKARLVFSHATGHQVLTVTCNLPAPSVDSATAGKRCRRHRCRQRRGRSANVASEAPARAKTPARATTPPPATPAAPSPETAPPPAKRTRKRRNEIELLRDRVENSDFFISPPSSRGTPPSPTPPSPTPPAAIPPSQPAPTPNTPPPAPRDHSPREPPILEPVSPILELPAPPLLPDSPVDSS